MNLDQEQQQLPLLSLQQQQQQQPHNHHQYHHYQQQQQQQQQNISMALMSSGEYVNFKPINTIPTTTLVETSQNSIPLNNTALYTEMTIPMDLPTPPLSETSLTPFQATTNTTTTPVSTTTSSTFETMGVMTSSFKTPLLPMPTLEDIEDGVIYDQQQHPQQQQQIITQSTQIPTGILKYSTMSATIPSTTTSSTATTTTNELNLPLSFVANCTSSTVVSYDDSTVLTTSAPTATIGTTRHKYSGGLKTTADINNRSMSSSCTSEIPISDVYAGIVKSTMPAVATTTTITAQGLRLKSSGATSTAASNAKLSQQQPATSSYCCCCACFGKNPNDTHSASDVKTKKRNRKTQTLWSAFITNVGICALLLAYTFLGE